MDRAERTELLDRLTGSLRQREAETVPILPTFLPLPSHRIALRPETVVIRGGRGVGKSHLFQALKNLETLDEGSRELFQSDVAVGSRWIDAFSQTGIDHPEVNDLDVFARKSDSVDLRLFWVVHLVRILQDRDILETERLSDDLVSLLKIPAAQVEEWIPRAREVSGALTASLDATERRLAREEKLVFATYDHLDRIGSFDPAIRAAYVGSLLALWLSFSNRYRHLRAKIFLREDVFERGEKSFPDATKLRSRSVALEWSREDLYRVVVRHMAHLSDPMRAWLRQVEGLSLEDRDELGWMPGPMPEETQKAFADRLAGELMGKGVRKGYTYRWIPNHLQDAKIQVVPRSILNLVGNAAEQALKHPLTTGHRLFEPKDLRAALERTSIERVGEIREEYPLVDRFENLRGEHVLMSRDRAVELLGESVDGEAAGLPVDGERVFEELLNLGVLKVRPDGRVDVPDIYRYGYGIKRKGGVAVPK